MVTLMLDWSTVGLHRRTRRHVLFCFVFFYLCCTSFIFSFLFRLPLPFVLSRFFFFCPHDWPAATVQLVLLLCYVDARPFPDEMKAKEWSQGKKIIMIGEWREEKRSNCVELIDDSREERTSGWWSVEQKRYTLPLCLSCIC